MTKKEDWRELINEILEEKHQKNKNNYHYHRVYSLSYDDYVALLDKVDILSDNLKNDLAKFFYIRYKAVFLNPDINEIEGVLPFLKFKEKVKEIPKLNNGERRPLDSFIDENMLKVNRTKWNSDSWITKPTDYKVEDYVPGNIKEVLTAFKALKDTEFLKNLTMEDWFRGIEINNLPKLVSTKNFYNSLAKLFPKKEKEFLDFSDKIALSNGNAIKNINSSKDLKNSFSYLVQTGDLELAKIISEGLKNPYYGGYVEFKETVKKVVEKYPYLKEVFEGVKSDFENISDNIFEEEKRLINVVVSVKALEVKWNEQLGGIAHEVLKSFCEKNKAGAKGKENIMKYYFEAKYTHIKNNLGAVVPKDVVIVFKLPKEYELTDDEAKNLIKSLILNRVELGRKASDKLVGEIETQSFFAQKEKSIMEKSISSTDKKSKTVKF